MKCPKCGYLGFETTDRCRHCGYDFSLSVTIDTDASQALPLRTNADGEAPFDDFDLRKLNTTATAVATPPRDELETIFGEPPPERPGAQSREGALSIDELPLFTAAPPPARPPLAVRRATPEVPRRRTPRLIKRDVADVAFELEPPSAPGEHTTYHDREIAGRTASPVRRVGAAIVDALILGSISAAVLYLTLAIAGLSMTDWRDVPPVPMLAFLLLLNGGYLIGFTASQGQTIGKMLAGIRVITSGGDQVDVRAATIRAFGTLLSVALVGLPYLPVLFTKDRRALHDRLAGTRVIRYA